MRAALDSCCFGARAWPSMCHCRRVRREAGRRRESGCGGVDGACVVAPDPVRRARGRRTTETARRGGADGHWCARRPPSSGCYQTDAPSSQWCLGAYVHKVATEARNTLRG
ncbi:hypothetical protein BU14_0335s0020 [Porphyra umbilicalis]|uniref:Uncharacterized protein n=1 Tax=Porphyra umbilicalis TaxID=2786 RepID=A0A1X6NY94_PORUM|nr:hypothetical protein BU14_0335s0020 [Porphyra umbilicalis]|eukprot:OSX73599.1 hypothetical protein BU14_0335s0020 [Porphyra umbilicalis]